MSVLSKPKYSPESSPAKVEADIECRRSNCSVKKKGKARVRVRSVATCKVPIKKTHFAAAVTAK